MSAVSQNSPPAASIALHGETLSVSRNTVETGSVRVEVRTVTREEPIDEAVTRERVDIERVPIGRIVDAAPPDREEGDVTVISIVEEVVVVERRLMLTEEIRLRRVRTTERHRETVTLREQHAVIERSAPGEQTDLPPGNPIA